MPETRSPEPEFETLRELLDALGYDAESDDEVEGLIGEYADEYMVEDLGANLFVNLGEGDDGEGMSLLAKMSLYTDDAVQMWVLDAPFTVSGINRYLDELDLRVGRLRAIVELPDAGAGDMDDEAQSPSSVRSLHCLRATRPMSSISWETPGWRSTAMSSALTVPRCDTCSGTSASWWGSTTSTFTSSPRPLRTVALRSGK